MFHIMGQCNVGAQATKHISLYRQGQHMGKEEQRHNWKLLFSQTLVAPIQEMAFLRERIGLKLEAVEGKPWRHEALEQYRCLPPPSTPGPLPGDSAPWINWAPRAESADISSVLRGAPFLGVSR